MRIESEIKKWGNSLALRISGVMAELPKFSDGTKVVIEVTEEGFSVKRTEKPKGKLKLPYSESALLSGMTPNKAHADELAILNQNELGE